MFVGDGPALQIRCSDCPNRLVLAGLGIPSDELVAMEEYHRHLIDQTPNQEDTDG